MYALNVQSMGRASLIMRYTDVTSCVCVVAQHGLLLSCDDYVPTTIPETRPVNDLTQLTGMLTELTD